MRLDLVCVSRNIRNITVHSEAKKEKVISTFKFVLLIIYQDVAVGVTYVPVAELLWH